MWEAVVTGEPVPPSVEEQVRAERELDQVVAAALVRVSKEAQRVRVRRRVVRGPAGAVLVAEAGGASLLVVDSHGHRRFAELAHGSVSSYCIRHASCLVLVISPAMGIHAIARMHSVVGARSAKLHRRRGEKVIRMTPSLPRPVPPPGSQLAVPTVGPSAAHGQGRGPRWDASGGHGMLGGRRRRGAADSMPVRPEGFAR